MHATFHRSFFFFSKVIQGDPPSFSQFHFFPLFVFLSFVSNRIVKFVKINPSFSCVSGCIPHFEICDVICVIHRDFVRSFLFFLQRRLVLEKKKSNNRKVERTIIEELLPRFIHLSIVPLRSFHLTTANFRERQTRGRVGIRAQLRSRTAAEIGHRDNSRGQGLLLVVLSTGRGRAQVAANQQLTFFRSDGGERGPP